MTPASLHTDLLREHLARPGLGATELKRLSELGISLTSQEACGGLSFQRARIVGRTYTPDSTGPVLLVVPVWNGPAPSYLTLVDEPELADFVAFGTRSPSEWFYRIGNGGILGLERYLDALEGGRVSLYSTPLEWLQHGCAGACDLERMGGLAWAA